MKKCSKFFMRPESTDEDEEEDEEEKQLSRPPPRPSNSPTADYLYFTDRTFSGPIRGYLPVCVAFYVRGFPRTAKSHYVPLDAQFTGAGIAGKLMHLL